MKYDIQKHKRINSEMSLCKLLNQRKTKVGCLKTCSEDENAVEKFSTMNSSLLTSPKKERHILRGSLTRGYSDPESRTTRLSLCCAVTESSSQTPPHSNQFQVPPYDIKNNGKESQRILTKDSGSQTTESTAGTPIKESYGGVKINEIKRERTTEKDLEENCSIDLQSLLLRQTFSCPPSPLRYADEDGESINFYSSIQSFGGDGFSRKESAKGYSVDNLVISPATPTLTRQSSPDSVKSAPEVKYVKRLSSQDIIKENKNLNPLLSDDANMRVSMDSLARQSLLAAQVLHLIPTDKARERNFLQGRISVNSLLGPIELEKVLPNREIRIFIGTWNMNGQAPPSELNDFMLPSCLEHVPDIIVIGTQESYPERFDWEVKIQETIGPSHVLLHSSALGTIHLAVFIRRDLLWYCSVPEESSLSVRPGTAFKTKGAVAIGFILFGTSFLFITSHLTAHQDKVKERIHDIKRIVRSLDLPKNLPLRHRIKSKDLTQNFDIVFWFGDLNFRLSQTREDVIHWVEEYKFPLLVDLKTDQLKKLILEGTCLSSFQEASITFPPTYKYDPGTQNFDTSSKQRTPAYTDRILYKSKGTNLSCISYSSVPTICTSDHKPVWGVYKGSKWYEDALKLFKAMFDFSMFLELHFLLMSLATILLFTWFIVPYFYLAEHLTRYGYSEVEGSFLLSIIGVTNCLGMIGLGWAGDQPWMNVTKTYAGCLVCCGLSCILMPLLTYDYNILAFVCALFGLFFASNYSFTPSILIQLIPLENFTTAYGLTLLCQGIGNLIGPPLSGLMFDMTGDWSLSFYVAGAWIIVSGFLIILIQFTRNRKLCSSDALETKK